jgi:antitoxin HicB
MAERNQHLGSSLDDLLEVNKKMNAERLSKTKMAALMKTSRSALDRLLDPANTSVTLHTLDNAARAIGKTLHIELI